MKISWLFLVITLCIPSPLLHAVSKGAYFFGATTLATAVWGCMEYYKKKKLEDYFGRVYTEHKASTAQLYECIDKLQNESHQLQKDQEFLSSIGVYIQMLEQEYACELQLLVSRSHENAVLENFLSTVKGRITRSRNSLDSIEKVIVKEQEKISAYKHQLEVKLLEWEAKEKREPYVIQGQKLGAHLDALSAFFTTFYLTLERQTSFIKLELLLGKEFLETYAFERSISSDEYNQKLDKHIRTFYSDIEYQFPYVTYVERLKKDRAAVKQALTGLTDFKPLPFQQQAIEHAYQLDKTLQEVLEYIVTTDTYAQEKQRKPHFDHQRDQERLELHERQERLSLEVSEKHSHIEEEKRGGEIKLQKELNKAQTIANQKAEIEKQKKELEVKERKLEFEWAKLKEGEKFKETLHKNTVFWEQRCLKLQTQHEEITRKHTELQSQLSEVKKQAAQSLQSLESVLSTSDKESAHEYTEKLRMSLAPLRALIAHS